MNNVSIYIDNRETKLINNIKDRDLDKFKEYINIESQQLDIGDIMINFNKNKDTTDNISLIFERKTVQDLLSSLKDGRLHEQKFRLLENNKPQYITYIIEGDNITSTNNSSQNTLSGIYLHSMYRDGIHIVFTKNCEETVSFLLILATKCCSNPEKFFKENLEDTDNKYIDCVKTKTKKIKHIDKKTCYLLQLCQIPNISKVIAQNIVEEYPTLRSLITALDNSTDKKQLLRNIDKIGKKNAENILNFLGYEDLII
jgi:crossover junction endonuclease MUS81